MKPGDIFLARFPFGDVPGMKLRPVLLLTSPVGPVPEVISAYITSVVPLQLLPSDILIEELYYLAPDNKLMAVAAGAQGSTFVPGTPEALFQTHPASGPVKPPYDVSRDGRFLINTGLQETSTEPIHLLLNWHPPK